MESRKWLPADTRTRLIDLCKDRKIVTVHGTGGQETDE